VKGSGYRWRYKGKLTGSILKMSNGGKEKELNRAERIEKSLPTGLKRIQCKRSENRMKRNAGMKDPCDQEASSENAERGRSRPRRT